MPSGSPAKPQEYIKKEIPKLESLKMQKQPHSKNEVLQSNCGVDSRVSLRWLGQGTDSSPFLNSTERLLDLSPASLYHPDKQTYVPQGSWVNNIVNIKFLAQSWHVCVIYMPQTVSIKSSNKSVKFGRQRI